MIGALSPEVGEGLIRLGLLRALRAARRPVRADAGRPAAQQAVAPVLRPDHLGRARRHLARAVLALRRLPEQLSTAAAGRAGVRRLPAAPAPGHPRRAGRRRTPACRCPGPRRRTRRRAGPRAACTPWPGSRSRRGCRLTWRAAPEPDVQARAILPLLYAISSLQARREPEIRCIDARQAPSAGCQIRRRAAGSGRWPARPQAGWVRRNLPKCGTVNAIRPRSEL